MKKLILIPLMLVIISLVGAFPSPPSTLFGDLRIDNEFAPVGTVLELFTDDGKLCNRVVTEKIGSYTISCEVKSEKLRMHIDGRIYDEEFIWVEGGFERKDINIIITPSVETLSYENSNFEIYLILAFMSILLFILIRIRNGKE